VNNSQFSVDFAKTINQEERLKAAKHRLLRQIDSDRPRALKRLGLHIGDLALTLALVLKLKQ
jgi:hypothetical protein